MTGAITQALKALDWLKKLIEFIKPKCDLCGQKSTLVSDGMGILYCGYGCVSNDNIEHCELSAREVE
ncbi:MAG: hypothetical protein ACUZ8E_17670 [Candidatus Anammoxibacter sp.]